MTIGRGLCGWVLALLAALTSLPAAGDPLGAPASCGTSAAALGAPLVHSARLVENGHSPVILAIGSSSTSGIGASAPAMSYPSRLEHDLGEAFPRLAIRVVNDGRGGQDADQEVARLDRDLGDEHPDLVIWQVGTNALLRGYDLDVERALIERGIALAKEREADVVLMDLQYAPRVLARSPWPAMERLIADTAKRERVGYFRRFEIMREWSLDGRLAASALIGRDGLHMTDASYSCLAAVLARSLGQAWQPSDRLALSPAAHRVSRAGSLPAPVAP
jgi:lysophospholipase L1-like esterase